MCGISGFNFENKPLLKKMCDLITHRGPDDVGYYTDSGISIGMKRLSIIDLHTGHQPQYNENEDIWVIFNGEIYNFMELKNQLENLGHNFYTKSDTEVIIHAYEEWGEDCVKKFRGAFAFCIYDSRKKILFLARDHMGLKPLYYYFDGEKFIFGSEIKCILCHGIKRIIDKEAFNLFISLGYVPNNLTLFKGIFKVPSSSYLIFNLKQKQLKIKPYWNINFDVNRDKSVEQLAMELRNLIEESVKLRLISDVPLGAFLSGGIDSSSIVGIMSKFMDEPVKTFSIGFEEGAPVNETKHARYVAEYYNTDHTETIVKSTSYELLPDLIWHLDDLISDAAIIPVYLMAKYAKEKMTVALTGDGADEVFAGYSVYYRNQGSNFLTHIPKTYINNIMRFYKYIPIHKLRMVLSYLNESKTLEDRYIRTILYMPDVEKPMVVPFETENVKSMIINTFVNNLDMINQFTNWDLKYQLPNLYNMKTDKMTMAASLEARIPFLDIKIVEWASKIPSDLKLSGDIEKYILRLAMKDILPRKILKRKKMGFTVPVNLWFKTGFKEVSGEILERLEKRMNLIKPKYVKILKRNHFKREYKNRVWNLIMFELWYETFIENDGLKPISLF